MVQKIECYECEELIDIEFVECPMCGGSLGPKGGPVYR